MASAEGGHQGSEGRWEAMRVLSSRPFCSCESRRVSLWDLSVGLRYATVRGLLSRTSWHDCSWQAGGGGAHGGARAERGGRAPASLCARKAGASRDAEARKRLERAPSWVWTAMDPTRTLLVGVEGGSRPLWPWRRAWGLRGPRRERRTASRGCCPMVARTPPPPGWPTAGRGGSLRVARPQAPGPRSAGGRGPRGAPPQAARRTGAGVSWGARPGWGAGPRGRASRWWRPGAGPCIRPVSSGSPSLAVSGGRPSAAACTRCARAPQAGGSSGPGARGITTACGPTRVGASGGWALQPPMVRARPRCGGRIDRSHLVAQSRVARARATVAATASTGTGWPGKCWTNGAGSVCLEAGKEACTRSGKPVAQPDDRLRAPPQAAQKGATGIIRQPRVRDRCISQRDNASLAIDGY
jgi:hypothetical protein